MSGMGRREFVALFGGAAAAWPIPAKAEQSGLPVIGFLTTGSPGALRDQVAAFHQGLNGTGYFDNQNVVVESHSDRCPKEVVARRRGVGTLPTAAMQRRRLRDAWTIHGRRIARAAMAAVSG